MQQRRALRQNIVRGVRIAWEASPRDFIAIGILSIVSALMSPIAIWLGKVFVDQVIDGARAGAALDVLVPAIAVLCIVAGADRALALYRGHQQELFARRVELHAMRRFLMKASSVDVGHHDDPSWHDRMARARRDVNFRPFQLAYSTIGLVASAVSVAGLLGVLASLHPLLFGLSLLSLAPGVLVQRGTNRRIYEFHYGETTEQREGWYLMDLLGRPDGAKELRAFGLADHFLARYTAIANAHHARLVSLYRRASLLAAIAGLAAAVGLAAAYLFIGDRGLARELTAGDIAAAIGAFAAVTAQASLISGSLLDLEQHATFLDDYFAFLAVEPIVRLAERPRLLPAKLDGIVVEKLEFTYPRATKPVLQGIDLEVRPGELVALVGENGAGKTTIVNLLSRFYDPSGGAIRFGGADTREVDPAELRSRIGVLFQEFGRYQFTLRENVRLGRIGRSGGDAGILDALEAGRAKPLVERLTAGLDSRVGRLFEGGHELSGGEWQRLAVARLIYRSAELWILDEPTAHLDPQAEAEIFAELKQQLAGRMAIVISHRFSTVRVADRIYVIEEGRVLEAGTHDELMAKQGRYAELFELQAAAYR